MVFEDSRIGNLAGLIIEELRRGLATERDTRAEALFKDRVKNGLIQFRLRLDGRNWVMPFDFNTNEPEDSRHLVSSTGGPLQKSLFTPIFESDLNSDEQAVAIYLDDEKTVDWWHRNVARTQYGIQGWMKGKIYPDFVFAICENNNISRVAVVETKGDHLDNLDTAYKRELLTFLSEHFSRDGDTSAGELELTRHNGKRVVCKLILMNEWKVKLPELVNSIDPVPTH